MTQMIETLESRNLFSATLPGADMAAPHMPPAVQTTARYTTPTLNTTTQPNLVVISIIAILIGL